MSELSTRIIEQRIFSRSNVFEIPCQLPMARIRSWNSHMSRFYRFSSFLLFLISVEVVLLHLQGSLVGDDG
jgi:hypothetical protein